MSSPSPDGLLTIAGPPVVLVVGEALVDVVSGTEGTVVEHVGGSPANVALGLGRLGVPVRLHTALGRDVRGERISAHLTASGVRIDPRSWSLPRTSTAIAHIGPDGAAEYDFDLDWRLPALPVLAGEQVVHVGSVAAFLEPGATTLEEFLTHVSHVRVTFDPNIRPALVGCHATAVDRVQRVARMASVVKLSDEDAAWLYPGESTGQVLDRFLGLGVDTVAITFGAAGAALASQAARIQLPAPTVQVADTVGAGDTFMAALIDGTRTQPARVLDESDLHRMGSYAAAAAAITVQRSGADLPYRRDLAGTGTGFETSKPASACMVLGKGEHR